jgi:oligopeptide/dipeptide ABC transporter ATP-binding protein
MALLDLRDVYVEYRRPGRDPVVAVAGVSLKLEGSEIMGLVGETGCGKSTLAKAAVGLLPLSSGSIWFQGRQLTALTRRGRSREAARLQLVFQNPFSSLNPRRKIGAQVADPIEILKLLPRRQRLGRVRELLEEVGIPARAVDQYPHQFSGGQRQRIAIARALAAEPKAIVMDEPLSALDASAQAQIANLLLKVAHRMHVGILLIAHDLAIVRQIADSVSVMYLGLVMEMSAASDIWTMPKHPYTQALINSIPGVDGAGILPEALPGEVPDPSKPPTGCRFHPRCPSAFDRCKKEVPPLVEVGNNRKAACWLVPPTLSP